MNDELIADALRIQQILKAFIVEGNCIEFSLTYEKNGYEAKVYPLTYAFPKFNFVVQSGSLMGVLELAYLTYLEKRSNIDENMTAIDSVTDRSS
jgi:hypothetical protein